ncbi:MAG: helix-turn-helix transcriptional regulator, partial [Mesorhizobium sp.]|uniref:winged helix-turn-helix transcriptional regulator n=1 Tax=Mesorhizobium sp. TaxID=1871066 RepID=UPI0012263A1B
MDSEDSGSFGYDAFRRTCPSHTVLEMLASKWVYLTVCALRRGRLRNGELARKLEGITPKMLTQTLRGLERDGLVRREVYPVIPPRVEYELTELGQNLAGLLSQIRSWAEEHA